MGATVAPTGFNLADQSDPGSMGFQCSTVTRGEGLREVGHAEH